LKGKLRRKETFLDHIIGIMGGQIDHVHREKAGMEDADVKD